MLKFHRKMTFFAKKRIFFSHARKLWAIRPESRTFKSQALVPSSAVQFIMLFWCANRHNVVPTASEEFFSVNLLRPRTFFGQNCPTGFVNIYSHFEAQKIFVLFCGIFVLFRKSAFFAQKWAFLPPECARKFTTSEVVKTTSDFVLTTSKLVLTTFELVFARFGPKKGRNCVVPPL